jgi:hypothetical protein
MYEFFQQLNDLETLFFNSGCPEIFIKIGQIRMAMSSLRIKISSPYLHVLFAGNFCCHDVILLSHVQYNYVGAEVLIEVVTKGVLSSWI